MGEERVLTTDETDGTDGGKADKIGPALEPCFNKNGTQQNTMAHILRSIFVYFYL
jgi:hypothetical protein